MGFQSDPSRQFEAMDQPKSQTTIIPHSQKPLVTRIYPSQSELDVLIQNSVKAQKEWARVPLQQRIAVGRKFMASSLSLEVNNRSSF